MISKELIQQLKEAGFPIQYNMAKHVLNKPFGTVLDETREYGYKSPTLSELIEECGDKFASLDKRPDWKENDSDEIGFWHCWGRLENNKLHVAKTPEEAVAKLYLEIRKLST